MPTTVMVCDDEIHIARAVEMKLLKAGYHVQVEMDGRSAWETIQENPPALLITDCQMPRMGGLELCRRLREHPPTANLPVILLTAKGLELDQNQLSTELWISRVVLKPFSPRDLLKAVQELLGDIPAAIRPTEVTDKKR